MPVRGEWTYMCKGGCGCGGHVIGCSSGVEKCLKRPNRGLKSTIRELEKSSRLSERISKAEMRGMEVRESCQSCSPPRTLLPA